MENKKTYISCLTHALIRNLKADKACIAATIVGICQSNENGVGIISKSKLAAMFGVSELTIHRALQELRKSGAIDYVEGDGRGHATTYKKGINFDTLCEDDKRVSNLSKKGIKNDTPKLNINKNNKRLGPGPSRALLCALTFSN